MSEQRVVDLFQQIASNEFGFFARLQTVMDLVDRQVPTVSCDDNFGLFVGRRDVRSMGSVGVIDPDDRQLIGVLDRTTVQRCYPRYLNTLVEKDDDAQILGMSLTSFVTRPVPHVPSTATPLAVLELFEKRQCDCVFVYDDSKKILGVVRPTDFLKTMMVYYQIHSQVNPLQRLRLVDLDTLQLDEIFFRGAQTARDVMGSIALIDESELVLAAVKAMHDNQTTVLGVLDESGDVTSVVTADDVFIAQSVPTDIRALAAIANRSDTKEGEATGKLALLPWDILSASRDPVMREPVQSLVGTKVATIEATTRVQEVVSQLLMSEEDLVFLVKSGSKVEGVITVDHILRIFKTLLKIQGWGTH